MAFDWDLVEKSVPLLGAGLLTTVKISSLAMLLGLAVGGALGLGALSRSAPVRVSVRAYVDFIRGTPLLIQIFLVVMVGRLIWGFFARRMGQPLTAGPGASDHAAACWRATCSR